MKKLLTMVMIVTMSLSLFGCGGSTEPAVEATTEPIPEATTESIPEDPCYLTTLSDGEKHDFNYLYTLSQENDLKFQAFMNSSDDERRVELVGTLENVHGETYYKDFGMKRVTSALELRTHPYGGCTITVETSGLEKEIMDWEAGDYIKVTGTVKSDLISSLIYIFQEDGDITVEKIN